MEHTHMLSSNLLYNVISIHMMNAEAKINLLLYKKKPVISCDSGTV